MEPRLPPEFSGDHRRCWRLRRATQSSAPSPSPPAPLLAPLDPGPRDLHVLLRYHQPAQFSHVARWCSRSPATAAGVRDENNKSSGGEEETKVREGPDTSECGGRHPRSMRPIAIEVQDAFPQGLMSITTGSSPEDISTAVPRDSIPGTSKQNLVLWLHLIPTSNFIYNQTVKLVLELVSIQKLIWHSTQFNSKASNIYVQTMPEALLDFALLRTL